MLPGKLRWQSRESTYLRPIATENPALRDLSELANAAPWSEIPVFKYWELEAGAQPVQVVASFANGKPALLERQLGAGSVILMTTPISDPAHSDPWNLLPTGPEPWPFLALANSVVQYLAGVGQTRLNYQAGQTIVLPLSLDEQLSGYVLQLPDGTAVRQSLTPGQRNLSIAATDMPGNYRARAGGQVERLDRGFSVNVSTEASRLDRVAVADVVKTLGKERTHLATNRAELSARVGSGRFGRELFPILILVVAVFMAVEQWLTNRFYGASSAVGAGVATTSTANGRRVDERPNLVGSTSRTPLPVSSGPL